jgi:hypothetical protein
LGMIFTWAPTSGYCLAVQERANPTHFGDKGRSSAFCPDARAAPG